MMNKTTIEHALQERIAAAFPAGDAPAGLLAMLTGERQIDTDTYQHLQRAEQAGRAEIAGLNERLRELAEAAAFEERAFRETAGKLAESQATQLNAAVLGERLVRGMANARIVADNERDTAAVSARLAELEERQRQLSPLLELAHVRAGHKPHTAGLADKLGVTPDDLMTDAERRKLDDARQAEADIQQARRANQERQAAIWEQQERQREIERLREQAEIEELEQLTPVQWLNVVFEGATPVPELVRMLDGRGSFNDRAVSLQTLRDRQSAASWPNYSPAQRRACALLFEHISGQRAAKV